MCEYINEQAEEQALLLTKQMAEREGVTEQLKAQDQMLWVQRMNNIRGRTMEVVNRDLIYA
ncbi:MAG: TnpV protein [Oscillospiraceae bacterium]|nr:TnpV protein [Oscillospiraceae bacterium]